MGKIEDLPDEVLFMIYRRLDTQRIKALLVIQGLRSSIYKYLYDNCKYVLQYDKTGLRRGLKLSQARQYHRHVRRFRYLQVNICLREGEDVRRVVEEYREIWNENPVGTAPRYRRNINLHIHLYYTPSSFNSIKDVLSNVREVSQYFDHKVNDVKVDLMLHRDVGG